MQPVTAYRPKPKRDLRVSPLFWQGVYSAAVFGLLSGAGVWGVLALGGAEAGKRPTHGLVGLALCGVLGALAAAAWTWGSRGLDLVGRDFLNRAGFRLEWLLWHFTPESDEYDRRERVELRALGLARCLLGLPVGLPLMVAAAVSGQLPSYRPSALWSLQVIGLVMGLAVLVPSWRWVMGGAPPPPPPPATPAAQIRADRASADMDSALQLAVAKARRAKSQGDNAKAIQTLELALQDAETQGRSTAHMELHRLLGWLYAKEDNPDGAIVMFETVLGLAKPGSAVAQEAQTTVLRLQRRSALAGAREEPPAE